MNMKNDVRMRACLAVVLLTAFAFWTAAIGLVDVKAVGPEGSAVGFATLNNLFHGLTGVHMDLYHITDWLSLIPLGFICGFAVLGLVQWIRRKHILKVDHSILTLGGFYIVVMAAYVIFEKVIINYRPVLINGVLEASYPSSTTMLVMCVIPTAIMQLQERIRNVLYKRFVVSSLITFTAFMVIGRLVSGVHWLTDIIGGALLSCGLVMVYHAITKTAWCDTNKAV